MSKAGMYFKMFASGAVLCIGGPALVIYVTPTEEELFKRYNPELQKRSLEGRQQRQQDMNDFVGKLIHYSKSSKPIWEAAAEDEAQTKQNILEEQKLAAAEIQRRRDEIKRHSMAQE
ncbi:assembly factor cbp4 [Bachmanniomyces sp. S44760]|nr:assembly factor cbp4 [Bachmanniomyces sp. S44760]